MKSKLPPPAALRVYAIDASVSDQGVLAAALSECRPLNLVGAARQVRPATRELSSLPVDVVLIDIQRDGCERFEDLEQLRRSVPGVPIVVFSRALARPGVAVQALSLGACACVLKPALGRDPDEARADVAKDLTRALLQICASPRTEDASAENALSSPAKRSKSSDSVPSSRLRLSAESLMRSVPPASMAPRSLPPGATAAPGPRISMGLAAPYLLSRPPSVEALEIVVIGASTGGLPALAAVIAGIGTRAALPIVISQHMLPSATPGLVSNLTRMSGMPVHEAVAGALLDSQRVWLAPGGRHVLVLRGARGPILELRDDAPRHSCRPSADVLFESAALAFGARVLGVVLTGIGRDGLDGCRAIRAAGGRVIVQDEATSVAWGMPGSIHKAGLADAVLPIEQIGATIRRWMTPALPRSTGGVA